MNVMHYNITACARNWKTTLMGAALLIIGVMRVCGLHVDDINTSPETLILSGFGLIFAKDATRDGRG